MAMINCNECQKEISDSANSCPHCGYILTSERDSLNNTWQILIGLAIGIYGFGVVFGLWGF